MMIAAAGGEENLPIRELILRIEAGDKPIRELVLRIGAGDRRTPILNTQLLTVLAPLDVSQTAFENL